MGQDSTNNDATGATNDTNQQGDANQQQTPTSSRSAIQKLTLLFNHGKLDAASWFIRIYLVIIAVQYSLLGGSLPSVDPYYKKALISNALVACIRLHQRTNGAFSFSREHFARIMMEDSAHYLMYSMIFLTMPTKLTLALLPVTLMALIHSVRYSYNVLNALEVNTIRGVL